MMVRRRNAKPAISSTSRAPSSGPRWMIASPIRSRTSASGVTPATPAIPHTVTGKFIADGYDPSGHDGDSSLTCHDGLRVVIASVQPLDVVRDGRRDAPLRRPVALRSAAYDFAGDADPDHGRPLRGREMARGPPPARGDRAPYPHRAPSLVTPHLSLASPRPPS